MHQIAAGLDVSRPGHDEIPERHVGAGLVAMQSAFAHQIVAKLAKSKSGAIVAEVRSEDHAKPDIREARSVAVTVLEAEIDHSANHEGEQVLVGEQGRGHDLGENLKSGKGDRIAHER